MVDARYAQILIAVDHVLINRSWFFFSHRTVLAGSYGWAGKLWSSLFSDPCYSSPNTLGRKEILNFQDQLLALNMGKP
jgi:hypothetical protein